MTSFKNHGAFKLLRGTLCLLDERMNYYHDTYSTGGWVSSPDMAE